MGVHGGSAGPMSPQGPLERQPSQGSEPESGGKVEGQRAQGGPSGLEEGLQMPHLAAGRPATPGLSPGSPALQVGRAWEARGTVSLNVTKTNGCGSGRGLPSVPGPEFHPRQTRKTHPQRGALPGRGSEQLPGQSQRAPCPCSGRTAGALAGPREQAHCWQELGQCFQEGESATAHQM